MECTYKLQSLMAGSNFLLAIRDNFESLLSKSVFSIVESQMNSESMDVNVKNRIFSVVVECVQNICTNDLVSATNKNSILLLNKVEEGYNIVVGTKLNDERRERLSSILDEISSLSSENLKLKKKEILSSKSTLDENQKESLALIDMFNRSEGNIEYHFEGDSDSENFLIIEIKITNN